MPVYAIISLAVCDKFQQVCDSFVFVFQIEVASLYKIYSVQ